MSTESTRLNSRAAPPAVTLQTRAPGQQKIEPRVQGAAEPFEFEIRDLRSAWERTERRLADLTISGTDRLGGFAAVVSGAVHEVRSLTDQIRQRLDELTGPGPQRMRYYVAPAGAARWRLKHENATRATRQFSSKIEAVQYGRAFVRSRLPSELVVCRADGSVQAIYRYD